MCVCVWGEEGAVCDDLCSQVASQHHLLGVIGYTMHLIKLLLCDQTLLWDLFE